MPLPERILIDTSAFFALLSSSGLFHDQAKETFERVLDRDQEMWTTSYVLVETIALTHHRLGFQVLSEFIDTIQGSIQIFWVESNLHNEAWNNFTSHYGAGLGFVDWTAALVSRVLDAHIFTFDRGFANQGLPVIPRQ